MPADEIRAGSGMLLSREEYERVLKEPLEVENVQINLRFIERALPGTDRKVRVLQQLWVRSVVQNGLLFPLGQEWRDVPLVIEEVSAEVLERRRQGLPDYEKPPLGQPPSWLQEQEKKD